MRYIKLLILLFTIINYPQKLLTSENLINQLKEGGKIVLIRHAYAPGNGDPKHFTIKDCSTQRNLDNRGIKQAKAIGTFFKKNNIPINIILSSEWCRCKDTAFYAFQNFETNPFLNSFYDSRFRKNKKKQMMNLKNYINKWNKKKNLILITHYVVIQELLNISVNSGEIIISDSEFNVISRIENKL